MLSTSRRTVPVIGAEAGSEIRDARRQEIAALFPELDPARLAFAVTAGDDHGAMAFAREPFDSELFGLEIGRITGARASSTAQYRRLFEAVLSRARIAGYDQVLRRTAVSNLAEIWALEARRLRVDGRRRDVRAARRARSASRRRLQRSARGALDRRRYRGDRARHGARAVGQPLRGRPRLRARPRARAQIAMADQHPSRARPGVLRRDDGRPAGRLRDVQRRRPRAGIGEIELVGTMPAFRGRRVASRVLAHALCVVRHAHHTWSPCARRPPTSARPTLYERAGFTLRSSDLTFRRGHQAAATRGLYENGSGHGRRGLHRVGRHGAAARRRPSRARPRSAVLRPRSCSRRWRSARGSRS